MYARKYILIKQCCILFDLHCLPNKTIHFNINIIYYIKPPVSIKKNIYIYIFMYLFLYFLIYYSNKKNLILKHR